jgi:hypothetical protein
MKLKLLAAHYLSDGKALHWHELEAQLVLQIGRLTDLNALCEVIGEKQKPGETLVARPALAF